MTSESAPAHPAGTYENPYDAGPYAGFRADDGSIEIWDADDFLFRLPERTPLDLLPKFVRIYEAGRERGEEEGRSALQFEIRRLIGAV